MASAATTLDLQHFYPEELKVISVDDLDNEIIIHMHSVSRNCICYKCGAPS